MKNKIYLFKKPRTFLFVQIMLVFGLFTGSLQAQVPTHIWSGGNGDWNDANNWNVVTTTSQTAASTSGSTTLTLSAANAAIAVGDYVSGPTTTISYGTRVTAVAGTAVTIDYPANVTNAAGAFVFYKPGATGVSFPGSAANHGALIFSGTCTITANPANPIKSLLVENTSSQGKLIINSGITLALSNAGAGSTPLFIVRGGLVENNGELKSTATIFNGNCVRFDTPLAAPSGDWGIIGSGILTFSNTSLVNNNMFTGSHISINHTLASTPKIVINSGSTFTALSPSQTGANPAILFNIATNSKVQIQGSGLTAPASVPLFKTAAGSTVTIDSGVTLTSVNAVPTTIAGTINNSGTIISSGLITNTGTINNISSGKLILKSEATAAYLFTLSSTTLLAITAGDTYTSGGATFTVVYSRLVNSTATVKLLAIASSSTPVALSGTLTKVTGSGDASIAYTAVEKVGIGYLSSTTSVDNVTQDRYLSSNQRGWRLLSNPLTDVTYGSVATASTTPLTLGNGTAKTYDSATNTWTVSNTDDTQTWGSKTAVSLFVRGRTSEVTGTSYSVNPPSNVTVSVTGAASNTAPATINTISGQYYLVANPYTAPVSVSSILTASTGLSTTVSYYNPTVGSSGSNADLILKYGGYTTPTVSGVAGSTTDVIIPPMGAFFVQATADGTINVPKTVIFTGTPTPPSGNYTHKSAQTKIAATNALKLEVTADNTYYDTVSMRFKAAGDASSNIDFGKLPNTVLDAYSIAGSNKMAVSELELKEQMIPLGITSTIQKSYSFRVAENTIPAGFEAVLVDTYLNKNTVLAPGTDYVFAIDSNPASQGDTRFAINLKTTGTLGVVANALDANIQVYPNPSRGQFNITNTLQDGATIEISSLNGQRIHMQKLNSGTTTIQTKSWATGVYILKAANNGTETTKKLIIQ
ncbi:T9SS type A sorting domain-containing protein [Flavobacterium nackdongense]|uniref:T9SS type A sorting domain-containing protein n=1 Tax=Flavobacterium nackdongense TaxID=2547394 RepID=A0A4P6YBQ6_9FLAO|nr:T9SS type A sorting domain-containing protein [Flavobacterium nackdongense]QBN20509.1 T9SS type A sorting domain-containing protein [Flavobacterium nackdongense]